MQVTQVSLSDLHLFYSGVMSLTLVRLLNSENEGSIMRVKMRVGFYGSIKNTVGMSHLSFQVTVHILFC